MMKAGNSILSAKKKEILLLLFLLCGCIEPFDIQSIEYQDSLVIEGFISSELKQHQVTLAHTSLISERKFNGETGAQVSIEDQNGKVLLLKEEQPGIYLTEKTAGVIGNTYTLNVTTKKDKQYVSSGVKLLNTPPITDIRATFTPEVAIGAGKGKIDIFVDTEDPTNEVKFYRWEFRETYEIKAPYPASFIWLGGNDVIFRDVPVDRCWANDSSRNTLLHSTAGLHESKVTSQLIQTIPGISPAMRIVYSILINQFSLSEEAYQYWKKLKDLNETQGSLYDRQPGPTRGNIKSLSDDEVVLGFFGASSVTQKRAFFTPDDFSEMGYRKPKFLSSCETIPSVDIPVSEIGAYYALNGQSLIISETAGGVLFLRPKYCCDCTNLGTNVKPSFWP
jgi:Domain of unknown function (DUF4249)